MVERVEQGVRLRVSARGRPVAGAEVLRSERVLGATDAGGELRVPVAEPGPVRLQVRALGFDAEEVEIEVPEGRWVPVDISLAESAIPLNPMVVTGTLSETRVKDSPVKVEVVSARLLERHASRSLMESVDKINGLYGQVDCGVCYTNNIRINGMEGPYTAVLIDGMPIQGALASVYGLNGIHPALVERLEILKGPQSTLYGSEAMGGVVNVITKDARFAPKWSLEASRSDLGENNVAFSVAPGSGRSNTLLSGVVVHNGRFIDDNGDNFTDLSLDTRLTLFGKTDFVRDGVRRGGLTAKLYREDRFGGVPEWTEDDLGSSTVYGEDILTERAEVMGNLELWGDVRVDASYAFHRQDSWYGDTRYAADQHIGFTQLLWDPGRSGRHDLLAGATLRYGLYDDNTPATPEADHQVIPGLFVEDQFHPHEAWTLLGGMRADHHESHGVVLSPRASVMWRPDNATTLRLNAGTGFRTVNLFTEDHAALTGARRVVIEEALEPERSASVAVNLNREFLLETAPLMLDVDLFRTRFSNRILPDYDTDPNAILYRNLDGETSVSRGAAVSMNQNFGDLPLLWTAGITVQEVFIEDGEGVRRDDFFAPDYRGTWTVSYTVANRLTLDWSGIVTGPMRLPAFPEPFARPTRSPRFTTHDVQATLGLGEGRQVLVSVRNVAGYRQPSPLVAPGDPFGEAFDTSYIYGPIVGRRVTLGVRWAAAR